MKRRVNGGGFPEWTNETLYFRTWPHWTSTPQKFHSFGCPGFCSEREKQRLFLEEDCQERGRKGHELRYCLIVMIVAIMIQQLQILSIFLVDWWNHHAIRGFWYDGMVHWHWQVPLSLYQSQGVVTQSAFFGSTKNRYVMELQSH